MRRRCTRRTDRTLDQPPTTPRLVPSAGGEAGAAHGNAAGPAHSGAGDARDSARTGAPSHCPSLLLLSTFLLLISTSPPQLHEHRKSRPGANKKSPWVTERDLEEWMLIPRSRMEGRRSWRLGMTGGDHLSVREGAPLTSQAHLSIFHISIKFHLAWRNRYAKPP